MVAEAIGHDGTIYRVVQQGPALYEVQRKRPGGRKFASMGVYCLSLEAATRYVQDWIKEVARDG